MGIFCKVFERDGRQVLVVKEKCASSGCAPTPAVTYTFELADGVQATVDASFRDDDEGYKARDALFAATTEDTAFAAADKVVNQFIKDKCMFTSDS